MDPLPDFIDEKLWFTQRYSGPNKKYYLCITNPHTFVGRMYAWDDDAEQGFCVSKEEIATCSTETVYFVKGFLAGNEPAEPLDADGYDYPDDHPLRKRWLQARDLFRITGTWAEGRICEKCGQEMLPSWRPGVICHVCSSMADA